MTRDSTPEYLVSALVSTYKGERFMRGCLEDLEAQTIADQLEIIVVDSCSPGNEREIVEEFQRKYGNIKYIRTDKRETIYEAWNRGARAATAPFLTSANTDDRHRTDAFEQMAKVLDADPACAVVYADCAVTVTENQTYESADITAFLRWPDFDRQRLFQCSFIGPQPMWRRSLHDHYGWFDSEMTVSGDYEFWLRLAAHDERFFHLREVLGLYLASPSSIEHSNSNVGAQECERARRRYWRKSWGKRPPEAGYYLVPYVGKRPLVTVVIPTRNRVHLLTDALRSLLAQDYDNWEAIVVNDGGSAVTDVAHSLDSRRIRCIDHFSSFGPAAARNTALRLARGEIICYLDDDGQYFAHHLSTIVQAMQTTLSSFVYTDCDIVTESMNGAARERHGRGEVENLNRNFSQEALHIENYIPINTWGHRRDSVVKCGLFDETLPFLEDWDFLIRMARVFEPRHVPQLTAKVRRRRASENSTTKQQGPGLVDVHRLIYARHGALPDSAGVRRGRRQHLARIAEHELRTVQVGLKRKAFLCFLVGLGGFRPIQRALSRYA